MTKEQATVGARVRTLRDFCGVPKGTEGVIDENYGSGVMVAWDFRDPALGRPLPSGYARYDGRPAVMTGILRDGFDKDLELQFLEVIDA